MIRIYDCSGKEVAVLVDKLFNAGPHEVVWTGTNRYGNALSSGLYMIRMETPGRVSVKKVTLIKLKFTPPRKLHASWDVPFIRRTV